MPEPISIVIVAFNQLELCRACVESVLANTSRSYRLVLVDNGSTDGVGEYFDTVAEARVIHTGENLGFAGGVNKGLAEAKGHIVLLNSDTVVPRGWLQGLETSLLSSDDIGMVGPLTNSCPGSQCISGLELSGLSEINGYAEALSAENKGKLRETYRLVGFCMMIRDSVFKQLGPLDDAYTVGYYEDDDYCLRVMKAGYRLCIADDCFVFHHGGKTFEGMDLVGDRNDEVSARNRAILMKKWGSYALEYSEAARQSKLFNLEAKRAIEEGDIPAALKSLKLGVENFPLLEDNYNDLGAVLKQLGDEERAYEHFKRAVILNPSFTKARENLAATAAALGKEKEANELLNGAVKGWREQTDEEMDGD